MFPFCGNEIHIPNMYRILIPTRCTGRINYDKDEKNINNLYFSNLLFSSQYYFPLKESQQIIWNLFLLPLNPSWINLSSVFICQCGSMQSSIAQLIKIRCCIYSVLCFYTCCKNIYIYFKSHLTFLNDCIHNILRKLRATKNICYHICW